MAHGCFGNKIEGKKNFLKLLPNQMSLKYDARFGITFKVSFMTHRHATLERALVGGKMFTRVKQNLSMLAFKMVRCKKQGKASKCTVSKKCYVSHMLLEHGGKVLAVWLHKVPAEPMPPAWQWILKNGGKWAVAQYHGDSLQLAGGVPCGAF